jgi:hypothetical protein
MTSAATSAERVRSRKPATDGPRTATLVRGRTYGLLGRDGSPDQWFQNGETVEVDRATFERLSNATDTRCYRDGDLGRVVEIRRKFRLTGPDGALPEVVSTSWPDCDD